MAPLRTCRALAVAGAFTCILAIPPAVHAQSTQPSSQSTHPVAQPTQTASQPTQTAAEGEDGSKLPVSLDRIREGIQREPALKLDFLDPSIPLFRVHVEEDAIKLSDYWKVGPDTAVSRDVRPYHASRWHHDFLSMVTPKQQIAASAFGLFGNPVFPVGPPVLAISSALKKAFSNMERGRIRRQIQEELKEIEANKSREARQTQKAAESSDSAASKEKETKAAKQP
jgi:hypothetical protein